MSDESRRFEAELPLGVRLQKLIATAGVASRRAAETLMREGRVTVNGTVVATPGSRANPETDDIRVDGRRVSLGGTRRYLLLNKPRGVVTTRDDPQRRRTVMDLLSGVRESVYPVGRLDYDSDGLLLLTNDGDLAARLTHPRHGLERVYEARVRGVPDATALKRLARGVMLDGRRTAPATASLVPGRAGSARQPGGRADHHHRGTKTPGASHVRGDRAPGDAAASRPDRTDPGQGAAARTVPGN